MIRKKELAKKIEELKRDLYEPEPLPVLNGASIAWDSPPFHRYVPTADLNSLKIDAIIKHLGELVLYVAVFCIVVFLLAPWAVLLIKHYNDWVWGLS